MKKFALPLTTVAVFLLTACGDTVENTTINQTGVDVYASADELPECTEKNEGEQAFVKDEDAMRVCVGGKWKLSSSGGPTFDFSCKTVELKDKSGLKIVCNGDSIGVVLNGSDGKDGKEGKPGEKGDDGASGSGCSITDRNDTAVVVQCGDSTMVLDLGLSLPKDTAELDSESTPISLDSLVGFTQKGPFLKGATVYLYELSDGRTLKQTNGNFTSNIAGDDGHYKFTARNLVSQYAMVVVDGYYRNEVTGTTSNAAIRLKALTDMRKHSSVNVNILTHLEFDRVYHLVTLGDKDGKKLTVKQAKRQAQSEILKEFFIELKGDKDAEAMDVFGAGDADAALLAVSILLQGDRSEADLMALLSQISFDMTGDGVWNDSIAKAKFEIADWAARVDAENKLATFRNNVLGWGLSPTVPDFEKYIRKFYETILGLGKCGGTEFPVGSMTYVTDPNSAFYARSFDDTEGSRERFVCKADGHWKFASAIEKDVRDWGDTVVGAFRYGDLSGQQYIYTEEGWRYYKASFDVFYGEVPTVLTGVDGTNPGEFFYFSDSLHRAETNLDDTSHIYWPGGISSHYGVYYLTQVTSRCSGICGQYTPHDDSSYAGFGFLVSGPDGEGSLYSADVSAWEGLCFTYTSTSDVFVQLGYADAATALGPEDFMKGGAEQNYPSFLAPPAYSTSTVCAGWDDFVPLDPEQGGVSGRDAAKMLTSVRFIYFGGEVQSFNISGISKIKSSGKAELNTVSNLPKGCGDLWCGADKDEIIRYDDTSFGVWYDFTDGYNGGMSSISYPIRNSDFPLQLVMNDVLDSCHGICGTVSLRGMFDIEYVHIAFTMTGEEIGTKDISSWEGICVAYESQLPIEFDMWPTDDVLMQMDGDVPYVSLPATRSGMVVRDIRWEQFKQYGWSWGGQALVMSGLDISKAVQSLSFKIVGKPGDVGDFAIYGLGRLGTCSK